MCIAVVDPAPICAPSRAWTMPGWADRHRHQEADRLLLHHGSGEIGKLSQPGKPLYGIEHSNGGLITFPGGLPIIQNGELFGAIGVSGSSVENDHKVAVAGCKVLGESQLADHHFARMMSLGA
jgi:hypothetical protein